MIVKRYFWIANVIMVTIAAVLISDIAKSYLSAKLAAPVASKPVQTRTAPSRQTRVAFKAYDVIVKRNIFNANPKPIEKPPNVTPAPQQDDIKATELRLRLVGTVASVTDHDFAIIEDLSNRGSQALYEIGDSIQNALIVEIRPTCVVFDKQGNYESLCFEHETNGGKSVKTSKRQPPSAQQSRAEATNDDDIVRVDAGTWRVSRELVMDQFGNLAGLSDQARVTPYTVQGQTQGFRVTRLRRNSLLQRIGIQNGDVIQKVNGLDILSPNEALKAFQQLQNESTIRVEILRRKRATTLTYQIR